MNRWTTVKTLWTLSLLAAILCAGTALATPLDDYVKAPDPAFAYDATPVKVVEQPTYTASVYHMTSQEWLDDSKVDRTAWKHWVTVIVPKDVAYKQALLFVNGGSNRGGPPEPSKELAQVATMTKSVLIDVGQIPNQPLHFKGEMLDKYKKRGRGEDDLIAYGWDKYLVTGDPLWLPRLPMTKAIVRAMDLAQKEYPSIDGFFVAGGSKRGWTTWTTAAVDKRVIGISPAVIDVLNVVQSLDNHHAAYGFWAPAIGDYEEMDILTRLHTPEFAKLCGVVDPYSYRDRLTMPKYILSSTGDQFFPPNSWEFYFNDLPGENYLRYMPNTDHGLSIEAFFNMASFYHSLLAGTPRPKFTWKKEADGSLEIRCETTPTKVLLWQATNPKARDFRLEEVGKIWTSSVVEGDAGVYRAEPGAPDQGWRAFFLEVEFPNPAFMFPFKFTTGVSVLPDTFPHPAIPGS
ncbi:MAG: PhoPQ-activated pathogenicity [Nitrospiraceae bacterium]|nr:PhoPQ-activated pathogenicity [Nitrospiraceae bacterium]